MNRFGVENHYIGPHPSLEHTAIRETWEETGVTAGPLVSDTGTGRIRNVPGLGPLVFYQLTDRDALGAGTPTPQQNQQNITRGKS